MASTQRGDRDLILPQRSDVESYLSEDVFGALEKERVSTSYLDTCPLSGAPKISSERYDSTPDL